MAVRKITEPGTAPEKPGTWQKSPIEKHGDKSIEKDKLVLVLIGYAMGSVISS